MWINFKLNLSKHSFQTLSMFLILVCICLPLAFPSLFLSFKLFQKNFLGTLFNKSVAVMLVFTGNYWTDVSNCTKPVIQECALQCLCVSSYILCSTLLMILLSSVEFSSQWGWCVATPCIWYCSSTYSSGRHIEQVSYLLLINKHKFVLL